MYDLLMRIHLATVLPCIPIGVYIFAGKKGTKTHRSLGAMYMILMLTTASVSLFMPAKVGPQFLNHFGWIHLLCILTMWTVPSAYSSARRGRIQAHQRKMILLYVGAILIAGFFTLMPGRYLHSLLFG